MRYIWKGTMSFRVINVPVGLLSAAAIAQNVFKNHTHIAVIKPYKHLCTLNQMRYHSQIVSVEELEVNENTKLTTKEIDMEIKLVEQLSGHFKPTEYHDRYVEDLEKTISKMGKSAKIKTEEKVSQKKAEQ